MEIFDSIASSGHRGSLERRKGMDVHTGHTHKNTDISQIHAEYPQITESSSCLFILIEIVTVSGGRGMVYVLNLNTLLTLRCHNSG